MYARVDRARRELGRLLDARAAAEKPGATSPAPEPGQIDEATTMVAKFEEQARRAEAAARQYAALLMRLLDHLERVSGPGFYSRHGLPSDMHTC